MDEAVFISVCERHLAAFYRIAVSMLRQPADAEDAVQQALLNAWQSRPKATPGLERAWIMRIVINESISILRKRRRVVPVDDFPCTAASIDAPNNALHEAISSLPDSLRMPLLLKYMEGMTEKEVGAALHIPLPSVKNRLFRARRKLQKLLNEEVSP